MDKKGEIDYLSKIIKPDVSVITNINYAHAKNFKSIKHIAVAKSEIIQNTKSNGYVVLNADDKFYKLHKKIALKNNLRLLSFGIKNQKSDIKLSNIKKNGVNYKIEVRIKGQKKTFSISSLDSTITDVLSMINDSSAVGLNPEGSDGSGIKLSYNFADDKFSVTSDDYRVSLGNLPILGSPTDTSNFLSA